MSDLKERLREAYRVTSYNSINGCAECGIAANDAMEAADRIEQLEAALREIENLPHGSEPYGRVLARLALEERT